MKKYYFLALATLLLTGSLSAATIFVSPTGLVGNDGTSWSTPKDLLSGINAATATDEIWVKSGTYPISAVVSLVGKKIYGGFVGTETSLLERVKSDLDGNGLVEPWEFNNLSIVDGQRQYPVFSVSGKWSVVDGLVFQHGFYNVANTTTNVGTGLHVNGAVSDTIDVKNCIVRYNRSTADGNPGGNLKDGSAGLCAMGPNVTVDGCLIEKDTLDLSTNTIYTVGMLTNGTGAEIINGCIKNSIIRNNLTLTKVSASGTNIYNFIRGGGVFVKYNINTLNAIPRVINCIVANNEVRSYGQTSGLSGGGLYQYDAGYVENCTIVNNKFTPYLNADGTGTRATGDGAGFYSRMGSTATAAFPNRYLYNTVVWGNISTAAKTVVSGFSDEFANEIYLKSTPNWSSFEFKNVVTTENYGGASKVGTNTASGVVYHTASNCRIDCSKDNAIVGFVSPSTIVGVGTDAEVKANWSITENSFLKGKGFPISDITKDFMGNTYNATTPAVGAYEYHINTAFGNIVDLSGIYRSGNIVYGIEAGDKVIAYTLTGSTVMNSISNDSQILLPKNGYYLVRVIKNNGKTIIIK